MTRGAGRSGSSGGGGFPPTKYQPPPRRAPPPAPRAALPAPSGPSAPSAASTSTSTAATPTGSRRASSTLNETLRTARLLDRILIGVALTQLVRRLSARTRIRAFVAAVLGYSSHRWSDALRLEWLWGSADRSVALNRVVPLALAALQLAVAVPPSAAATDGAAPYSFMESATGATLVGGLLIDDAVRYAPFHAPPPLDVSSSPPRRLTASPLSPPSLHRHSGLSVRRSVLHHDGWAASSCGAGCSPLSPRCQGGLPDELLTLLRPSVRRWTPTPKLRGQKGWPQLPLLVLLRRVQQQQRHRLASATCRPHQQPPQ